MKLLNLLLLTAVVALVFGSCGSSSEGNTESYDWAGTYTANESGAADMNGEERVWEYTLAVVKSESGYTVDYDIDGYQTMQRMDCTAKDVDGSLVLYFAAWDEENMNGDEGGEVGKEIAKLVIKENGTFKLSGDDALEFTKK